MNVHGPWLNLALMLGMEKDASLRQQFFEFVRRYEQYMGSAAHKEIVGHTRRVKGASAVVKLYDLVN